MQMKFLWSNTWDEKVVVIPLSVSLNNLQNEKRVRCAVYWNENKSCCCKVTFESELVQGKIKTIKIKCPVCVGSWTNRYLKRRYSKDP